MGHGEHLLTSKGRALACLFAGLVLTTLAVGHAAAQRQLVMYCGVDEKWCRAVANAYQKETGVQVDMTRMSAGEVYARVRAEKENPHGDVWFGGTGDPHLQAADERHDRALQVAHAAEAARLGAAPGAALAQPHGRAVPRRARLRLQHRGHARSAR